VLFLHTRAGIIGDPGERRVLLPPCCAYVLPLNEEGNLRPLNYAVNQRIVMPELAQYLYHGSTVFRPRHLQQFVVPRAIPYQTEHKALLFRSFQLTHDREMEITEYVNLKNEHEE